VSEVLRVLGIKAVDLPWPLEALDSLPNGRMNHDFSQFGSSKWDVPHILDTGRRLEVGLHASATIVSQRRIVIERRGTA